MRFIRSSLKIAMASRRFATAARKSGSSRCQKAPRRKSRLIGPYGTAHMMMLLGRHSRLILDSSTRPKYARVRGRKASEAQIECRCWRYGRYAGLAFWLYIT